MSAGDPRRDSLELGKHLAALASFSYLSSLAQAHGLRIVLTESNRLPSRDREEAVPQPPQNTFMRKNFCGFPRRSLSISCSFLVLPCRLSYRLELTIMCPTAPSPDVSTSTAVFT